MDGFELFVHFVLGNVRVHFPFAYEAKVHRTVVRYVLLTSAPYGNRPYTGLVDANIYLSLTNMYNTIAQVFDDRNDREETWSAKYRAISGVPFCTTELVGTSVVKTLFLSSCVLPLASLRGN